MRPGPIRSRHAPDRGKLPASAEFAMTEWGRADIDSVMTASSDPLIRQFTSMPDAREDLALTWITAQPQLWRDGVSVHFALRDGEGRVLGNAGFIGFEWVHRRGEVGYWVLPEFRRRGIASSALALVTQWAFDSLPLDRVDLYISPENRASTKVAERVGYECEGRLRSFRIYRGVRCDLDLYRQLRTPPPPPPPPPRVAGRRERNSCGGRRRDRRPRVGDRGRR